jgi:hypothetical protein
MWQETSAHCELTGVADEAIADEIAAADEISLVRLAREIVQGAQARQDLAGTVQEAHALARGEVSASGSPNDAFSSYLEGVESTRVQLRAAAELTGSLLARFTDQTLALRSEIRKLRDSGQQFLAHPSARSRSLQQDLETLRSQISNELGRLAQLFDQLFAKPDQRDAGEARAKGLHLTH